MKVFEKLLAVQSELKAPKNQYNSFGEYHYRSCEDILEAVKPLCAKHKALTTLSDKVVFISGRFYVEATANFIDAESGEMYSVTASAREDESKKKMDGSQMTGCASSYARKYALNGLFDIDDTKDADTDAHKIQTGGRQPETVQNTNATMAPACPVCGKTLTGYVAPSGRKFSPSQEFAKLGMCADCFKKNQEVKR